MQEGGGGGRGWGGGHPCDLKAEMLELYVDKIAENATWRWSEPTCQFYRSTGITNLDFDYNFFFKARSLNFGQVTDGRTQSDADKPAVHKHRCAQKETHHLFYTAIPCNTIDSVNHIPLPQTLYLVPLCILWYFCLPPSWVLNEHHMIFLIGDKYAFGFLWKHVANTNRVSSNNKQKKSQTANHFLR